MTCEVEAPTGREERWERSLLYVPFGLLALSTVVVGFDIVVNHHPHGRATVLTGVLLVVTVGWMWWWRLASDRRAQDRRSSMIHYVGRTVLAAALTLLDPLYCIFAWSGFLDVNCFRGRPRWVATGATSVVLAVGQVGGLPFDQSWQPALFAGLILVNFSLSTMMLRYSAQIAETSEHRAATIAELRQALAENARLHEQLLRQEHEAGIRQERERLALEIHDTIAQSLAGVVAQLQAAKGSDDPDDVRRRTARATDLARTALTDARRSVQDLHPAVLAGGGLAEAIGGLVDAWRTDHGGEVSLVVTGRPRELHPEVEASVLRITQEALTNVARHARAGRVGVTLTYDEDEVVVDVRDDGAGFDPTRTPTGSFGLEVMRRRAERMAGRLDVESGPGSGTAVSAHIPALTRGAV